MESNIHSYHSFMFPFRWDYIIKKSQKETQEFTDRTNLADFDKVFSKCNTLKKTKYVIANDNLRYNEYVYFHDFVKKVIFYTGDDQQDPNDFDMLYYELDGNEGDYFSIKTVNDGDFNLSFEGISMHIYSTGVGILCFNLNNYSYSKKEEILKINEFGRRMFPQFLGDNSLKSVKETFLADQISGQIGPIFFEENFEQYSGRIDTNSSFMPPDFVKKVFGYKGQDLEDGKKDFVFRKNHEDKGKIRISKLTDDRMFFLCWYGNDELSTEYQRKVKNNNMDIHKNDWWYKYVYGDKAYKTIANSEMQKKVMAKNTYSRWSEYGTFYGMTRDSFVCVSSSRKTLGSIDLYQHMRTMYYQMAVLCLAQRASVLRFSYEVSLITDTLEKEPNPNKMIQDLYKNYIQFINKLYFREITSQSQGIEIYTQFQSEMNLAADVKDLDKEISELHEYVSIVQDSNLNKIALWFLPLGAIAGLLGANMFDTDNFSNPSNGIWFTGVAWLVGMITVSFLISGFLGKYLNRKRK